VVYTDLDGTLLQYREYSFQAAEEALQVIRDKGIPLVIVTSKTRAEVELWRRRLRNAHPFVVENGGGIFVPKGYFREALEGFSPRDGYLMKALGAPYPELRQALQALRERGFRVRGFADMDTEEVASLTGLGLKEAELAKRREFDEPFLLLEGELEALKAEARAMGYSITEGRVLHILRGSDKGRAVRILNRLFEAKLGKVLTVALGDSPTDAPMFQEVDIPVLLKRPEGDYHPGVEVPGVFKAPGIGPEGWNLAMKALLARHDC